MVKQMQIWSGDDDPRFHLPTLCKRSLCDRDWARSHRSSQTQCWIIYLPINVICGEIINCQMIVLGHFYFYRFTFMIGKMFVIDCWLHFTSACFYCIYSFIVKCTPEHESLFRNCRTPSIARCLNNSLLFARLCLMIILPTCRLDAIIQKLL